MQLKRNLSLVAALATMTLASTSAMAVASYGDVAAPGVYFGSGNVNGNWTIDTDSGIELALRAKNRQTLQTIDGSGGTYMAELGACLTCTGAPKAMWSYEFSVNSGSLSGVTYLLGIDHDPSAGVSYSWVDPAAHWADNAIAGAPFNGFQNSQNVLFASTPGGPFDVNMAGLYSVTLQAWNNTSMLASTTMNVQVGAVPEPETYALMFAGLGVLGFVARRRALKQA